MVEYGHYGKDLFNLRKEILYGGYPGKAERKVQPDCQGTSVPQFAVAASSYREARISLCQVH